MPFDISTPADLALTLPDKPSALLRLALDDLAKVEALSDRYQVDMERWHLPDAARSKCSVCLAGSVMAMSLGADPTMALDPYEWWDDTIEKKLELLNELRLGNTATISGARCLSRSVPHYSTSPTQFRTALLSLASDLEALGL